MWDFVSLAVVCGLRVIEAAADEGLLGAYHVVEGAGGAVRVVDAEYRGWADCWGANVFFGAFVFFHGSEGGARRGGAVPPGARCVSWFFGV